MTKTIKPGGGKSFHSWWANPKNRQKVYDSDKADAEELKKPEESHEQTD
ncbi:MAG: hypothetical protein HDR86_05735 [Bacteroides sp.]|nr:hypothetical protein [Bacteroides sp.]